MIVDEYIITCCNDDCGISFAVPSWWANGKRENHSWFYCPNGHRQHFSAETDLEKMTRERNRLKQNEAYLEQRIRDEMAENEKILKEKNRLMKRLTAGICPCCNRHFVQLDRHMKSKHANVVSLAAKQA